MVDLLKRILMKVISMVVDGCGERIDGLKLRVAEEVTTFFRPYSAVKMMKTAWVLLERRRVTFLWWARVFKWPEVGDLMRERETPVGGERESLRYARVRTFAW
jgi:hypothetical protein